MSVNGDAQILRWPSRLLCASDVRRVNGYRMLQVEPATVVTPLAVDELRSHGIGIVRANVTAEEKSLQTSCGYSCQQEFPAVQQAIQALSREGISFVTLPSSDNNPWQWARSIAARIQRGDCQGGVIFVDDPALACCVANKVPGLRAASVTTVAQAARATLNLGANLLAVEMPGRTYFEARQILQMASRRVPACPPGVACTLQELDGHAHR